MTAPAATTQETQPVWFIAHGGPPTMHDHQHPAYLHWQKIASEIRSQQGLRGVVFVSAHWQAEAEEVGGDPRGVVINRNKSLLYDYYGFPPEYYKLDMEVEDDTGWLEELIHHTLTASGKPRTVAYSQRGIDHGVFVPLLASFGSKAKSNGLPPIVQLSLPPESTSDRKDGLRALELGEALGELRRQGVAVIGGGQPVHNLAFLRRQRADPRAQQWAQDFAEAASQAVLAADAAAARPIPSDSLASQDAGTNPAWTAALGLFDRPDFKLAHPTAEHLHPLLVCIGAGGPSSRAQEHFQLVGDGLGWGMYSWR
ncbi:unnamed protein product [Parajaminaea phylloscopi]